MMIRIRCRGTIMMRKQQGGPTPTHIMSRRRRSLAASMVAKCSSNNDNRHRTTVTNIVVYSSAALAAVWYYLCDNNNNPLTVINTTHCMGGNGLMIKIPLSKIRQAKQQQQQEQEEAQQQQQNNAFHIKEHYSIQRVLGRGAYGQVYEAQPRQRQPRDDTPQQPSHPVTTVALKAMAKSQTPAHVIRAEVAALRDLSPHPHVCQFVAFYDQDPHYYYLAMEQVQGGELFEHLVQHGAFSEKDAATHVRQLAEALCHVHGHGWAHGDLKPENLCLSGSGSSSTGSPQQQQQTLKLIDFGCATRTTTSPSSWPGSTTPSTTTGTESSSPWGSDSGESSTPTTPPPQSSVGTLAYMAPELLRRGATPTPAADMWAAGCIVYIVLTGSHPLDKSNQCTDTEIAGMLQSLEAESPNHLQQQAWMQQHILDERVHHLTSSAVEVLQGLFEPNPTQRMSSQDFCKHPWVQGLTASWKILEDIDQKLESFWHNAFRNEILRRFASHKKTNKKMTLSDENLLHIFHALDINGDGVLQLSEVEAILRDLGAQDIPKTFAHMDLDNSGDVGWEEFCAIMRRQFHNGPGVRTRYRQKRFQTAILKHFGVANNSAASQQRLRECFNAMDLDGNGVLDAHEIRVVLRSMGESDENISQIVAAIDVNHDGKVDWREFRTAMMKRYS